MYSGLIGFFVYLSVASVLCPNCLITCTMTERTPYGVFTQSDSQGRLLALKWLFSCGQGSIHVGDTTLHIEHQYKQV